MASSATPVDAGVRGLGRTRHSIEALADACGACLIYVCALVSIERTRPSHYDMSMALIGPDNVRAGVVRKVSAR